MKAVALIALAAAMYASPTFACSIDVLKKIAGEHLERFPSSPEHEFAMPDEPTDAAGGTWQVFNRENGTPHSIVLTVRNELGQDKIRISFLNRKNFVITETNIGYADLIQEEKERVGKFLINPARDYFFCGDQLQIPPDAPDRVRTTNEALYWKKWIFEGADELKPEIKRVPEQ